MTDRNLIHVQRSKLRRVMETEIRSINSLFAGKFKFLYTSHFVERILQRDVELDVVLKLLAKVREEGKSSEIVDFINSENRENRLEITDGVYWIGTTLDCYHRDDRLPTFKLRMVVVNDRRLEGRIPTKVIKVNQLEIV